MILRMLLLCTLSFCAIAVDAQQGITSKVTGTGQTTGHIATLTVHNTSDVPVSIQTNRPEYVYYYYIPSEGRYQSYVATIPKGTTVVPPGQSVDIPVQGICTDVHAPPVPDGETMPPMDNWITVEYPVPATSPRPVSEPLPSGSDVPVVITSPKIFPAFTPDDSRGIIEVPAFTPASEGEETDRPYVVTFPGTDIPVPGTIDPDADPEIIGPMVIEIVKSVEETAPVIQSSGDFPTPFSTDSVKESETIIQQTTWIVMSILTGDDYEEEDFAEKVYSQFTDNTGIVPDSLGSREKESLDAGVSAFWDSFVATGIEAKVLNDENEEPEDLPPPPEKEGDPPPPEEIKNLCTFIGPDPCTGHVLDYDFAATGNEEDNEEVKEKFEEMLNRLTAQYTGVKQGEDLPEVTFTLPAMHAASWSLWFPHAIGGRANATAFAIDIENPLKSVMSTEPIKSSAEGACAMTWRYEPSGPCTSHFIGVNFAKLRASSALSATMSHPKVAAVINFVGEVAIDFLIKRGKGTARKISKYLKEKVKDMAKDAAKDFIKEELQRLANELQGKSEEEVEDAMDALLEEIEAGHDAPEEEDPGEFLAEWMAEYIVEGDDFNIPEKIADDLIDKIDSPSDWSPIKTTTYALAKGVIDVWVEDNRDNAKAASGVQYIREGFEDREDVEKGGGSFCATALVTGNAPNQITLKTAGSVESLANATGEGIVSTGHGRATATLESFNAMYVVGICECPDETFFTSDQSVTYLTNEDFMSNVWKHVFENVMHKALEDGVADELSNEELEEKLRVSAAYLSAMVLRCAEE